jgi:hypothetical protein
MEEQTVIEHVIEFLKQNNARLERIYVSQTEVSQNREQAKSYNNALGFHVISSEEETYYIYDKAFKEEICTGISIKTVRKILQDKKMLRLDQENKNPKCQYTNPKYKRMVTIIVNEN